MRLYLICDNEDTALGLRLAGIEGTVTESRDEVAKLLEKAASDSEIGIILINQTLVSLCSEEINAFCKEHSLPLIIEIPDRHSDGTSSSIADYVSEAIGIKI
jgi:V/A-type H+-transporting ATPase subunit F